MLTWGGFVAVLGLLGLLLAALAQDLGAALAFGFLPLGGAAAEAGDEAVEAAFVLAQGLQLGGFAADVLLEALLLALLLLLLAAKAGGGGLLLAFEGVEPLELLVDAVLLLFELLAVVLQLGEGLGVGLVEVAQVFEVAAFLLGVGVLQEQGYGVGLLVAITAVEQAGGLGLGVLDTGLQAVELGLHGLQFAPGGLAAAGEAVELAAHGVEFALGLADVALQLALFALLLLEFSVALADGALHLAQVVFGCGGGGQGAAKEGEEDKDFAVLHEAT